jgi:hypothetical protein
MASDVNLDALIPREDLAERHDVPNYTTITRLSVTDLEKGFLIAALRKPDFQRETSDWDAKKIADLIRTFVDGDLIPGVILWQSGGRVFVIDGAHRLSALLAWIHNDYGDGDFKSKPFFKGQIPPEQLKVAERARKMIHGEIGAYSEYGSAVLGQSQPDEKIKARLGRLGILGIPVNWVPAASAKQAEDSFFKINQAATPIDDTELRILKARDTPSAIASRAIARGGAGHQYWKAFPEAAQQEIVALARKIHAALYEPPLEKPIKSLDLPVAGSGYGSLPFIFDLVNISNDVAIPDSTKKGKGAKEKEKLPSDTDGTLTVKYLRTVAERISRMTGDEPGSLGLHPAVYSYTLGGSFQPSAFLAALEVLHELAAAKKLNDFTRARRDFEEFLVKNKSFISLLVHTRGSGGRSRGRIKEYFRFVLDCFMDGKNEGHLVEMMQSSPEFAFLLAAQPPDAPAGSKNFSRNVKTAAFITDALQSALRCKICGARVHRNDLTGSFCTKRNVRNRLGREFCHGEEEV